MLQIVTQDAKFKYCIRNVRIAEELSDDKYVVEGYDEHSKQYVPLGKYNNYIYATKVVATIGNQQITQFKGGKCYNIFEMPLDSQMYFNII